MNPRGLGGLRPRGRLQRPADGLQGLQGALPRRQAHRGLHAKARRRGDGWTNDELEAYIAEHDIACPVCGKKDFTGIRQFNLMFKTFQGVTEDSQPARSTCARRRRRASLSTSRTCMRTTRKKLPFGHLRRSANPSATRSRRATSSSACASSSRWSWSSSASPATDLEWFDYWRDFCRRVAADPGHEGGKPAPARPRAGGAGLLFQGDHRLRVPLPLRLGRAVGRGGSARTTTSPATRSTPARAWSTSTP